MIPWAWLSMYEKRKAVGVCAYCSEVPTTTLLCDAHKTMRATWDRESQKRRRLVRKLLGICVDKSCKEKCCDRSFYCEFHLKKYTANSSRWQKTKRGRERCNTRQRRHREAKAELGICTVGSCQEELATLTMCEKHRREKSIREAGFRREQGIPKGKGKCRLCGKDDHDRRNCNDRGHEDMLPIEYYATARNNTESEMTSTFGYAETGKRRKDDGRGKDRNV